MKHRNNLALFNAKREAKIIIREIGYDKKYLDLIDACETEDEVSKTLTFARCEEF